MADTQLVDDPLSPTTIIRQYLMQNKMPLTPENYRRALEGNANNPGLIPGLRNNAPTSEAQDQADMKAAAPRSRGSDRGRQPLPTPPLPISADPTKFPPPPPDARSMMPAFTGTTPEQSPPMPTPPHTRNAPVLVDVAEVKLDIRNVVVVPVVIPPPVNNTPF